MAKILKPEHVYNKCINIHALMRKRGRFEKQTTKNTDGYLDLLKMAVLQLDLKHKI